MNEDEARSVRSIFRWFLELQSTPALERRVADEGIRSKRRATRSGRSFGGCHLTRGALRHILRNRIYLGVIPHGSIDHPGRHAALIDQTTFDAVQTLMGARREARKSRPRRADRLLLTGRVFDAVGLAMKPVFAQRKGARFYAYYVGPTAPAGTVEAAEDDAIHRVAARVLDNLVEQRLTARVGRDAAPPGRDELRALIVRVSVQATQVQIVVQRQALASLTGRRGGVDWIRNRLNAGDRVIVDPTHPDRLWIGAPVRLKSWGGRTFGVGPKGEAGLKETRADERAVRRLRKAHKALDATGASPDGDVYELRRAKAPPSTARTL